MATMRMGELSALTGLPRTTIHHYAREGLLPPPVRKTAPNAAEYDETHVERLRLIARLRSEEFGSLTIPDIVRVIARLDAGLDLRSAVRLVDEDLDAPPADAGHWPDLRALAEAAEVPTGFVRRLEAAGLIGTGDGGPFTAGDLLVARACRTVCMDRGVDPADLTPLAELLREVGNYARTLTEIAELRRTAGGKGSEADVGPAPSDAVNRLSEALMWRSFEGPDKT